MSFTQRLIIPERNLSRIRLRKSLGAWAGETGKLINRVGGALQLDALNADEVDEILEKFLLRLYQEPAGRG